MIVGTVITVSALILGLTATVIIGMSMGRPLYESLTEPSRATPVDEELTLRAGRYTVFQLTGHETVRGPETTTTGIDGALITAQDVKVTGPDGDVITTRDFGSSSERMTRDADVYEGAVRFTTPEAGVYRVRVTAPETAQVVIAPAFGSGFKTALGWLIAGVGSSIAFMFGIIVIIVGAVRRRKRPVPQAAWGPAVPERGWYSAPDAPGKQRYWDGRAWTQYLR